MKKIFILFLTLTTLFTMSGCYYTEDDIETLRYNAWEEGYQEGFDEGRAEAFFDVRDDYAFGYDIGWDEALKEYGVDDSGSDTKIGTGFRDGWADALYEYDITP